MRFRRSLLPLAPVLLLAATLPARAYEPALNESATEDTTVGYSIRAVRGWEPLPRKNPGDPTAGSTVGGWYSKDLGSDGPRCTVFAFGTFFPAPPAPVATPRDDELPGDGGAGGGTEGEPEGGGEAAATGKKPAPAKPLFESPPESFEEWLQRLRKRLGNRVTLDLAPTPFKSGSDEGTLYEGHFRASGARETRAVFAASVRRGGFEVAAMYEIDGSPQGLLRDFRSFFRASLKSLAILPQKKMERARAALAKKIASAGGDDAAWAARVIAGLPKNWASHRTDHYAIVYDSSIDSPETGIEGLIPRIGRQLEALRRDIYEPLFPTEKPVTAISVVKVTQDPEQYFAYGAPHGSAGYWSWPSRELVFFCKAGSRAGMDLTLDVLNHEAFHQYIYYAVGQVSPHSWFNEGHGDYFAGWNLVEGKFRPGKFHWRTGVIREAIERNTYVPLREFLKFSQQEYYRRGGDKRKGGDVRQNYAQGWSLIWFLRTTKDPKYHGLLDRYFNKLKEGMARWKAEDAALAAKEKRAPLPAFMFPPELNQKCMDEALDAAFHSIDLDELERDWIASKPY